MAEGQTGNTLISRNPLARQAMDQFKYEVASELGINDSYKSGYWGNVSSRECGAVGGHMVRKMIYQAQEDLAQQQGGTVNQNLP